MLSGTIAFVAGVIALYQLPALPGVSVLLLCCLLPLPLLLIPSARRLVLPGLLFFFGFSFAAIDAANRLEPRLAAGLEGVPVRAVGVIDSLPKREGRILRFELQVLHAETLDGDPITLPQRLRLSWYNDYPEQMRTGQQWQLRVKLKRPWAMRNAGGFDYEQWLFQQGIGATGYVRAQGENRLLQEKVAGHALDRMRQHLQQAIAAALGEHPLRGVITALAVGERSAINDYQWEVLLATGTNHLVAISGLHVGLVAGLVYMLFGRLWRLCPGCCLRLPAPRAASLLALLAALAYAALAGFAIPTQRALAMLAVVLGAVWLQRPLQRGRVLLLALWAVLLLDPSSVLAPGFWLSFAAVACILYAMGGRLQANGLWWRWGRVQFVVALGLMPLLLIFFQQGSLSSPLANLLAVPWVSLLVVPLTLLGVALWWWPAASELLWGLAAASLQWLWPLLQWLAEALAPLPAAPPWWCLLPALAGILWLLAPRGWPLRAAGVVLLLPLLLWRPAAPAYGEARFTLLDVGQGLSAVVQTRHHLLVFDTGPRYPSGFNTADAVVVPFLRSQGIAHIDLLLVSHSGNDHAGGVAALASQLPIRQVMSSGEVVAEGVRTTVCRRGDSWEWDGVRFRILHPSAGAHRGDQNDHSCVLRVDAADDSLLITGDIEAPAERALLASDEPLAANILIAPHHGSKTSSTATFVEAVAPRYVLFPVGYRNRYGFPHASVVKRYQDAGATLLRTDASGALSTVLGSGELRFSRYREQQRRLWHGQ